MFRQFDPLYGSEFRYFKGSGGGGGGGSGAVSYPGYMQTIHSDWLDNTGVDTISSSITDVMDTALGNSPWTGAVAYDPDTDISDYETAIAAFAAILAALDPEGDWDDLYDQANASITPVAEADIAADVTAFSNKIDDEITTKVLPRFQTGMRDINAVVSSAFVIGEAVIEGFRNREVAKHSSGIRVAILSQNQQLLITATGQMVDLFTKGVNWNLSYTQAVVEAKRIKIVAKKEETDMNFRLDESDALWDLEVFQYGANLLGSIGGGVVDPNTKKPSTGASMLGGAMSGAATGAIIGSTVPGIGTAVGALAGGILGAGSALL